LTYSKAVVLIIAFIAAVAAAAVGTAVASQSAVAVTLAIVGFLLGLFFGSRASGRPQPQETTASRALRPWMVAISVIGGLFVLPQVDKAWPGSAFGGLSIACAFIAGYLITNMIQTRRYRLESGKRLQGSSNT